MLQVVFALLLCLLAPTLVHAAPTIPPQGSGTTHYVSSTGSNSNTGTEASPWLTIQKGLDELTAGETLIVKCGTGTSCTYTGEQVVKAGGTATNYVTIKTYPGHTVTIDANQALRGILIGSAVGGSTTGYIRVSGFRITDAKDAGLLISSKKGIFLDNLYIFDNVDGAYNTGDGTSEGIWLTGSDDITFYNVTAIHNDDNGLLISTGCSDVLVDGGTYANNLLVGIWIHAPINASQTTGFPNGQYPIDFTPNASLFNTRVIVRNIEAYGNRYPGIGLQGSDHVLLEDNWIHDNGSTGIQMENAGRHLVLRRNLVERNNNVFGSETGIWFDENAYYIMEDNIIRENYRGSLFTQGSHGIVRRNIWYNNNGQFSAGQPSVDSTCLEFGPGNTGHLGHPYGQTDTAVIHNVCYANGKTASNKGGLSSRDLASLGSNVQRNYFQNNMVVNSVGPLEGLLDAGTSDLTLSDYNLWYSTTGMAFRVGVSALTYPGWKGLGYDSHSLSADPLFTNPASGDFSLQSTSSAINAGGWLTTAVSCSSTTLVVNNARYFSDGFDVPDVQGDLIQFQGQTTTVRITDVNYATNTITTSAAVTCSPGTGVAYPYSGTTPDIGAIEFDSGSIPPPPPPPAVDTTAPTVAFTAPTNASGVAGASVTVTATATDAVGVSGVQFKLDGVDLQAEDVESPYTITWDTSAVKPLGTHSLTASARDAAGNVGTATIFVSVANDYTVIKRTAGTVTTLADFISRGAEPIVIKESVGFTGTQATYRFIWDATNLYMAVEAIDTNLHALSVTEDDAAATIGIDDGVKLFLDGANDGGSVQDSDDWNLIVNLNEAKRDEQEAIATPDIASLLMDVAYTGTLNSGGPYDTDTGYTMIITIPWASIGVTASDALTIGLDLRLIEAVGGGDHSETHWANTDAGSSSNPAGWGNMVLQASASGTPGAPGGVVLTYTINADATVDATVTWTASSGTPTAYRVERCLDATGTCASGGTWATAPNGNLGLVLTYTDTAVTLGSDRSYRVYGLNGALESTVSAVVTGIAPAAPSAPTGLGVTVSLVSGAPQTALTWTPPGGTSTTQQVEHCVDGAGICATGGTWQIAVNGDLPAGANSYTESGLLFAQSYSYRIRAFREEIPSAYSSVVSITTPSATTLNAQIAALADGAWAQLTLASRSFRPCTNGQIATADTVGPNGPQSRVQNGMQTFQYQGRQYLWYFGGAHSTHQCNDVEVFDIAAGQWQQRTFPEPTRVSSGLITSADATTAVLATVHPYITTNGQIVPPMVVCVNFVSSTGTCNGGTGAVVSYVHSTRTVTVSSWSAGTPIAGSGYVIQQMAGAITANGIEFGGWVSVLTASGKPMVEHYQDYAKYDPVNSRMILITHAGTMAFNVGTNTWTTLVSAASMPATLIASFPDRGMMHYDPDLVASGPAGSVGFQAVNGNAPVYTNKKWNLVNTAGVYSWVQRGGYPSSLTASGCQWRTIVNAYIPDLQKHFLQFSGIGTGCGTHYFLYNAVADTYDTELEDFSQTFGGGLESMAYDTVNRRMLGIRHTSPITGWVGDFTTATPTWQALTFAGTVPNQAQAVLPSSVLRYDPINRAFLFLQHNAGSQQTGAATATFAYKLVPPSTVTTPDADFAYRCAQPGVLRCMGFDAQSEITEYIRNNTVTNSVGTFPDVDTSLASSGAGSLRFVIPGLTGQNAAGSYEINFAPGATNCENTTVCSFDYTPGHFGQGQDFYVQFRVRYSANFESIMAGTGGGGYKVAIIGTGDRATGNVSSCTEQEIVVQDSGNRNIIELYHSCGAKDSKFEPLHEPAPTQGSGQLYLQNNRRMPDHPCLYNNPRTGCVTFSQFGTDWFTIQLRVRPGTPYDQCADGNCGTLGPYVHDSVIQVWIAADGQPSELVHDWSIHDPTCATTQESSLPSCQTGYDLYNSAPTVNKYGKVWLLPYNTGKLSSRDHAPIQVNYDELIISTQRIPDPLVGSPAPTDVTPPSVSITVPTDTTTVSGNAVTLTASAVDDVGVSSVTFKINDVQTGTTDINPPYSITWDSTAVADGDYLITTVAVDSSGNTTTSAAITVTTSNSDVTAPTVSITAPVTGVTLAGTTTVTATAADAVGVEGVQFMLDGEALGAEDTSSPFAYAWDTSANTNGTHTLTAVARDAAGNTTTSTALTLTVTNITGGTLSTGLLLSLPFEEGTGATTADFSPAALTGTITGAEWTASGKVGNGLDFETSRTTDNVAVDDAALDDMAAISACAWVNPETLGDGRTILSKGGVKFYVNTTNSTFGLLVDYATTDLSVIAVNSSISTGSFQFLCFAWNGGSTAASVRLYVAGVEVASYATATDAVGARVTDAAAVLEVGNNVALDGPFDGVIDDVRVWSSTISTTDMVLAAATPAGPVAPAAPTNLQLSYAIQTDGTVNATVTWTRSTGTVTDTLVERCTNSDIVCADTGTWEIDVGASALGDVVTYTATAVSQGTSICWRAVSINDVLPSAASTQVCGVSDGPPGPATGLQVTQASGGGLLLQWTHPTGTVTTTQVEFCLGTVTTCTGAQAVWLSAPNGTLGDVLAYTHGSATQGQPTSYRIRASNQSLAGALSAVASGTAAAPPSSGTAVTLIWTQGSTRSPSGRLQRYIRCSEVIPQPCNLWDDVRTVTGDVSSAVPVAITDTIPNVIAGATYCYRMLPITSAGTVVAAPEYSDPFCVQIPALQKPTLTGAVQ